MLEHPSLIQKPKTLTENLTEIENIMVSLQEKSLVIAQEAVVISRALESVDTITVLGEIEAILKRVELAVDQLRGNAELERAVLIKINNVL